MRPTTSYKLSGRFTLDSPKPVVIDSANYVTLLEMLKFSKKVKEFSESQKRFFVLVERCRWILNPSKVRFINMKLKEAMEKYKDLEGIADVVVDNFGVLSHPGLDFNREYTRKMLKPNVNPFLGIIGHKFD